MVFWLLPLPNTNITISDITNDENRFIGNLLISSTYLYNLN